MAWLLDQESGAMGGPGTESLHNGNGSILRHSQESQGSQQPLSAGGTWHWAIQRQLVPMWDKPPISQISVSPLNFWLRKLKYTLASAAWKLSALDHAQLQVNTAEGPARGPCSQKEILWKDSKLTSRKLLKSVLLFSTPASCTSPRCTATEVISQVQSCHYLLHFWSVHSQAPDMPLFLWVHLISYLSNCWPEARCAVWFQHHMFVTVHFYFLCSHRCIFTR